MKRALVIFLGTLTLGLVLPLFVLQRGVSERPELAIRSRPLHVHAGQLLRAAPVGQVFRCTHDGLARIDVRAVAPRKLDAGPVELSIRLDAADAEVVRRVEALPSDATGQWLEFRFEPIAASADREVFVQLTPAGDLEQHPLRPWMRPRGQIGSTRPWGRALAHDPLNTLTLSVEQPDLTGVAVAMQRVAPEARMVLDVHSEGTGDELRRVAVTGRAVSEGYVYFAFDPIPGSYARSFDLALYVEGDAVPRLSTGELSAITYHGRHRPDEALGGMTRGGERFDDRDLVLRVWTGADLGGTLARLQARLGGRLRWAVLLWLACVAGVLSLALGPRSADPLAVEGSEPT